MPKQKTIYVCQECGAEFLRWTGKCEVCGEWNSLTEHQVKEKKGRAVGIRGQILKPLSFDKIETKTFKRFSTGIYEFDRVLGGGIVPGSVILLGGDPGIGKSTLILQVADQLARKQKDSFLLYISGEESGEQVKMRVERLGLKGDNLQFLAETNIENIIETIRNTKPALVIIDSIQTMVISELPSAAGSLVQVREASFRLIETAKQINIPIVLIGHITKEGVVAGPKTLEHLVDVVLYLEGDRYHTFRILRGVKNRFGSTNEAGVFEMKEKGLEEVKNPSQIFLEERQKGSPGSVVGATLEGNRPILAEIQGLTSKTYFGYPRRTASGFDFNRLQLLIAVLTKRAGIKLDDQDVYLNVAGGLKITEPACDLAVCLAIASAFSNKIIDPETVIVGEVGLSGEIRSVRQIEKRIIEAKKLGFKKILVPKFSYGYKKDTLKIIPITNLKEAIYKTLIR